MSNTKLLTTIADPEEALATPAPRIHDYGEEGNVHKRVSLEFGDVEQGFAEADEVFEDTFFFQGNTHLPIEQHASVAMKDPDGKLTIWSSTQTPHYLHRALAKVLQMPPGHIRVIATPNGGGFGGKSDPFNHEIVVAKAALMLDRPVKICLTREEVFYCHRGQASGADEIQNRREEGRHDHRHAFADADRWRRVRLVRRREHVLYRRTADDDISRSALQVSGMPHVHEQAAVRAETRPWHGAAALRARSTDRQNCGEAEHRSCGFAAAHRGVFECGDGEFFPVERRESFGVHSAGRQEFGLERKIPQAAGGPRRGPGLLCYLTGAGLPIYWNKMPHSGVHIKFDRGGGVAVFCGATEIGQGSDDVLAGIVAEVLGLETFDIRLYTGDTDLGPVDLGSYSSRVTIMAGNAALQAAERGESDDRGSGGRKTWSSERAIALRRQTRV